MPYRYIIISLFLSVFGMEIDAQHAEKHDVIANEFFHQMVQKDYKGCWNYIDPELKKRVKIGDLKKSVDAILHEIGNYTTKMAVHTTEFSVDMKSLKEYVNYAYHPVDGDGNESPLSLVFRFRNEAGSKIVAVFMRAK